MMRTKLKDQNLEAKAKQENQANPEKEKLDTQGTEFVQSEKLQQQDPQPQQQQQMANNNNSNNNNNKRKAMEESLSPDRTRPRYSGLATVV